jgi:hypothetical protein
MQWRLAIRLGDCAISIPKRSTDVARSGRYLNVGAGQT